METTGLFSTSIWPLAVGAASLGVAILLTRRAQARLRTGEQELERLRVLYEVGHLITQPLELDELLRRALQILRSHFGQTMGSVWLWDNEEQHLTCAASMGFPPETKLATRKLGEGLVGWAAQQGEIVSVPDTNRDPRYIAAAPTTHSEANLPLKVGQRVIGVLNLERSHTNAFPAEDVQMFSAFADWLATAVHRAQLYEEQARLALTDPLTDLPNLRYLRDYLNQELRRAKRSGSATSVLMIDLDHFKEVNDNLGHETGDEVLKVIADRLRDSVRSSDFVSRYGGEEFVIVLPDTPIAGARRAGERALQFVSQAPIPVSAGEPLSVTVSIGCATASGSAQATSDDLLRTADATMYQAKQVGRNQVRVAEVDIHQQRPP